VAAFSIAKEISTQRARSSQRGKTDREEKGNAPLDDEGREVEAESFRSASSNLLVGCPTQGESKQTVGYIT
jgi:hypothetical protein